MHHSRQSRIPAALIGAILFGALPVAGCGDSQQSGTMVQDTPEAQQGRKASMDGMKALMDQKGKAKGSAAAGR